VDIGVVTRLRVMTGSSEWSFMIRVVGRFEVSFVAIRTLRIDLKELVCRVSEEDTT